MCVCVLSVFRTHQKSYGHDILALGLIWANLKHDDARFSKFWFFKGVPIWWFFAICGLKQKVLYVESGAPAKGAVTSNDIRFSFTKWHISLMKWNL